MFIMGFFLKDCIVHAKLIFFFTNTILDAKRMCKFLALRWDKVCVIIYLFIYLFNYTSIYTFYFIIHLFSYISRNSAVLKFESQMNIKTCSTMDNEATSLRVPIDNV